MKKKIAAAGFVIWAILFALSLVLYFGRYYERRLGFVNYVGKTEEGILVIETDEDSINFMNLSDGVQTDFFSVDIIDENKTFTSISDYFYEDGRLYLRLYHNQVGSEEGQSEVCYVDMEKKRLVSLLSYDYKIYRIDDKDVNFYYDAKGGSFYVEDGVVHFIGYTNAEDGVRIVLDLIKNEDGEWEIFSQRKTEAAVHRMYISGGFRVWKDSVSGGLELANLAGTHTDKVYGRIFPLTDSSFALANFSDGNFRLLDAKAGTVKDFAAVNEFIGDCDLSISQLTYINGSSAQTLLGVYKADGSEIAVLDGKEAEVIDSVRADTPGGVAARIFKNLLITLVAAAVLIFIIYFIRSVRVIAVKVIAMLIPVILVCNLTVNVLVEKYLMHTNYSTVEELMKDNAQNTAVIIDNIGLDMELEGFEYSPEAQQRASSIGDSVYSIFLSGIKSRNSFTSTIIISYLGYDSSEDILLNVLTHTAFKRMEYTVLPDICDKAKECIKSGQTGSVSSYDDFGQHMLCTIVPDKSGGAYLVTVSNTEIDYEIAGILEMISKIELAVGGAMIIVLAAMIVISLVPLKKLRRSALQITEGNPGSIKAAVQVKRGRTRSEIDLISDAFNNMLAESECKIEEISNLRSIVNAYFSDSILKLIGKSSASVLDFKENSAATLYITEILLDTKPLTIDVLDGFIARLSPYIQKYDGYISDIDGRKLTIVSTMAESINIPYYVAGSEKNCSCFFDRAQMDIMIKSAGEEKSFVVSYSDSAREEDLLDVLQKLRIRFLASENSFVKNDSHEGICAYLIGEERFYDMFYSSQDKGKKLIRNEMESGLYCLNHGDVKQARECFVRAVKGRPGYYPPKYYIELIEGVKL